MARFEVVFEVPLYFSAFVEADDLSEAEGIAIDRNYPPQINLPQGFEFDQDDWFIGGVVGTRDD